MRTMFSKRILAGMLALHVAGIVGLGRPESSLAAGKRQTQAKHVIVYSEAGKFCGFPANAGAWSWASEILAGVWVVGIRGEGAGPLHRQAYAFGGGAGPQLGWRPDMDA